MQFNKYTHREKTLRRRSREEAKQVSGLVPRYLLPPSSGYVDFWGGWLRRACPYQGARQQTGRAQDGDILNESQHLAEGTEIARLQRRFSFALQQALLFRTCHHLCRQGVALASTRQLRLQGPVSVHAHPTEGVTGSKGREGANGVGGHIGVGGGNGDGNGVGGGNGDVNDHGNGDGAEAGPGVDQNEGAQNRNWDENGDGAGTGMGTGVRIRRRTQDGNGDESDDGTGTGTGTGVKTRRRTQDGNGDINSNRDGDGAGTGTGTETGVPQDGDGNGSGDGNESNSGVGNGDEDRIGEGEGEAKKRKKPHKTCRRHVRNRGDLGGKRKTRRKERVGPVASNPDNLEGSARYPGLK